MQITIEWRDEMLCDAMRCDAASAAAPLPALLPLPASVHSSPEALRSHYLLKQEV
jgi:hypothetical protein